MSRLVMYLLINNYHYFVLFLFIYLFFMSRLVMYLLINNYHYFVLFLDAHLKKSLGLFDDLKISHS